MNPYHFLFALIITVVCGFNPNFADIRRDKWSDDDRPSYLAGTLVRFAIFFPLWFLVSLFALPAYTGPFYGLALCLFLGWLLNAFLTVIGHVREQGKPPVIGGLIMVVGCILLILPWISSWYWFRATDYAAVIGDVTESEWDKDMKPTSVPNMFEVPKSAAKWKGDEALAQAEGALGSQFKTGNYTRQEINGETYWVAPLEYQSWMKWASLDYSPGFVMVSAEDWRRKPELVDNRKMLYLPSACWYHNLHRHIYGEGYVGYELIDFSFELNDNLKPYWVVTMIYPTIGYSGEAIYGIVICDPETGECKPYKPEDAPEWVDRIYPEELLIDHLTWWGVYRGGWWNAVTDEDGCKKPTLYPDPTDTRNACFVIGGDKKKYWYTGLTSTKSTDEALIDFVLADTRMGGVHIYKKKGCKTESAILQVADGTVSRWPDRSGTSPIPHNLDGHLTFVSPVVKKVKNGSIFFELCLVSDDGLVHANGKTKQEAIMKYLAEMAKNPNVYAASTSAKDTTDTIVVDRIGDDLQGSLKMFLFNARQKYPGRIFIGSTLTSPALALTQPGDTVEVTFALGETERVNLKKFSNPAIPLDISHAQKVLNRKEDKREQTQANEEKAASIKNQILEMDDQALIRWLERGGGLDNLPPRQEIQVEPENQN